MIRLYAFLGNYGKEYAGNRHNVAWQFLSSLSLYGSLSWERKFKGRVASKEIAGERIWFLTPETYMNNSGESIADLMRFYRLEAGEVLAIHDELEMAFGNFGFKFSGGLGGHNGLRSMEKHLARAISPAALWHRQARPMTISPIMCSPISARMRRNSWPRPSSPAREKRSTNA